MSFAKSAEKLDTSKFGILSQALWLVFRLFRYTIHGFTVHTDRIWSCNNICGSKMIRKIRESNRKINKSRDTRPHVPMYFHWISSKMDSLVLEKIEQRCERIDSYSHQLSQLYCTGINDYCEGLITTKLWTVCVSISVAESEGFLESWMFWAAGKCINLQRHSKWHQVPIRSLWKCLWKK